MTLPRRQSDLFSASPRMEVGEAMELTAVAGAGVDVCCAVCGKAETVKPHRAKKYRTCSVACRAELARRKPKTTISLACEICGQPFSVKRSHADIRKTCSRRCFSELKRRQMIGEGNHQYGRRGPKRGRAWKGGRIVRNGYVWIYMPDHPDACEQYIKEHRLVMERILGRRLLADEDVHHINGIKTDNRPENLELMTRGQHTRHHNLKDPQPRCAATGQYIPRSTATEQA